MSAATAHGRTDHLKVLNLTSSATDEQIKATFKKLALKWHPDRNAAQKEYAAQMFIKVNDAYRALIDSSGAASQPRASSSSSTSESHPVNSAQREDEFHAGAFNHPSRAPWGHNHDISSAPFHANHAGARGMRFGNENDSHFSPSETYHYPSDAAAHRLRSGYSAEYSEFHPPDSYGPPRSHLRSRSPFRSYTSYPESISSSSPDHAVLVGSRNSRTNGHGPSRPYQIVAHMSATTRPVIPPPSSQIHKPPRSGLGNELVLRLCKVTPRRRKVGSKYTVAPGDEANVYGAPLRPLMTPRGPSKEWVFPLPVILEEMFEGSHYRFRIIRELLNGTKKQVEIDIDIPSGCRTGMRIVCPGMGHEQKDGTSQDVVFIVEGVPHQRFSRVKDDLFMDICIPWIDALADQGGNIHVEGLDGEDYSFTLPYPVYDKATEGKVIIEGAGMPVCEIAASGDRGDLVVRWQIVFPNQSKWQTFKKSLHLKV